MSGWMHRAIWPVLMIAVASFRPAAAEPGQDWPQLGRDPQRSNYTPEKVGDYYPKAKWTNRWLVQFEAPVSQRATPVLAEGLVAIGTFDGVMHGIDHATGKVRWTFQAEGPIDHAAAIADGKVYFTSSDWNVYCLDARTGRKVWSYLTGRGVVVAPLVVDGRVYVGSKDGWFYCFQADTGKVIWKTDIGEPIDCSAAWSESAGLIFTGTVGMHAVALRPDGQVAWKRKLWGQSLRGAWPQVGEKDNVVIYRTLPSYTMWDNINHVGAAFQTLFPQKDKPKLEFAPWAKPKEGMIHHSEYAKKNWTFDGFQDRIQAYLVENPSYRTFFALNAKTGEDRYDKPVPVLYTWGVSQTMHAQAIDNAGRRAWAIWRGWEMLTDNSSMPNLGRLDLSKGRFVQGIPFRTTAADVQPGLHGGDEHTPITAAGDTVFHGQNRGPGGWSMAKLFEHPNYPDGYYTSFKVMGHSFSSSETAGMGPEYQPSLDPTFIRSDSQVIYSHATLVFQVGGGVTCWQSPAAERTGR